MGKDVPTEKDFVPIMVAAAHEGKLERKRVGHVPGNVEEIFEEPDPGSGESDSVAFAPVRNGKDDRKSELAQSAAVNGESFAQEAINGMAGFVEEKIGAIQKENETRFGFE